MAHFAMGRTLLPVYIMMKKNTPVMNTRGKTGLSCNKEPGPYAEGVWLTQITAYLHHQVHQCYNLLNKAGVKGQQDLDHMR